MYALKEHCNHRDKASNSYKAFDTRQNRRQLLRKLNLGEFGGGQLGRKLSHKNLLYKHKKLNLIS